MTASPTTPLAHRARPDDRRRPHDARLLALRAALRRPAQHRALDRGRVLLCRAQAPVHRRAGQCRLPRADRIRHSRHDAARRLGAAPGRRLHRDHPARHRRDLRRLRQGRAGARQGQPVRHHQRALARRLARARPALGHVLLLRRRPRRQSGERRAQPRQQPDLDRDHPAGGNSGVALSGDVHAMGAAAGFRRRRAGIAAGSARSTRSRRWPTAAPTCSCSASAASIRRSASTAAGRRRSTASSTRPTRAKRRRRWSRRSPTSRFARGQKVRLETPGGGGFGDPATREPERVVARRAARLRLARGARRDYKVVLRDDGSLDADATAKARATP